MRARVHTHTHTHTDRGRFNICTCTHTRTHAHIHALMSMCARTHTHTHTHTLLTPTYTHVLKLHYTGGRLQNNLHIWLIIHRWISWLPSVVGQRRQHGGREPMDAEVVENVCVSEVVLHLDLHRVTLQLVATKEICLSITVIIIQNRTFLTIILLSYLCCTMLPEDRLCLPMKWPNSHICKHLTNTLTRRIRLGNKKEQTEEQEELKKQDRK